MKHIFSLIAVALFATTASANGNDIEENSENTISVLPESSYSAPAEDSSASSSDLTWKKNYINVYCTVGGSIDLKQDFGTFTGFNDHLGKYTVNGSFGMSIGHTFYFGNESNKCRFGLDAEWMEFNYAHYKWDQSTEGKEATYGKIDISTGFGPSVTFQPNKGLYLRAYAHVMPTFMLTAGNEYVKDKGFTDQWSSFNASFQAVVNSGISATYKFIGLGIEYRYSTLESISLFGFTQGTSNSCRAYVQFRF